MSSSELTIPADPGSYLLALYLPRRTDIQVGRLGSFPCKRGWYFYAGSAFGAGGLKARIGHHLQPSQRYHWHIDYLRGKAGLRATWYQLGVNNEHLWSQTLSKQPGAKQPIKGFGSSDCSCFSHLTYLPRRPGQLSLRTILNSAASGGLRCWRPG